MAGFTGWVIILFKRTLLFNILFDKRPNKGRLEREILAPKALLPGRLYVSCAHEVWFLLRCRAIATASPDPELLKCSLKVADETTAGQPGPRRNSGFRLKGTDSVYKIEEATHGFTLTFAGTMYSEELNRWFAESERALARRKTRFGVIVDMRELLPLGPEAREIILQGQCLFRKAGLVRSAVILKSTSVATQFRQLAKDSLVYKNERYIDASQDTDCLKHALDWVKSEVDPDLAKG
jgi:hypothetical protein